MPKKISFTQLLDAKHGRAYINNSFKDVDKNDLFDRWYKESGESGEIYPSQGLLQTEMDFLEYLGKTLLSESELIQTLKLRRYMLEIFNHPERLKNLKKAEFTPPPKVSNETMEFAVSSGMAMAVGDLGSIVTETDNGRVSRRSLLLSGPFIKLGKYPRIPFASGAMPDVFGSPASLATMAMCHGLACVPRNAFFSDIQRQVDLAKAAHDWLENETLLTGRKDAKTLLKKWRRNLVGVIETEMTVGLRRAEALYQAGIRAFRVYSPEPGNDSLRMTKKLRAAYGNKIEIFAGQVVSLRQAKLLVESGVDGLYVGIGGGGRCLTAARSDSVVDWPALLWQLRGEIDVPIIVEGGASDHVGTTLLLGGSGIGVSRIAAGGTIESPGGLMYWVDKSGRWFKPYGGEASARTKFLDGKTLAFGIPAFVEGETTKALKSFIPYIRPTMAQNMFHLIEDLILSLVFRGVTDIQQLQSLDPSPLRRVTAGGVFQQGTH